MSIKLKLTVLAVRTLWPRPVAPTPLEQAMADGVRMLARLTAEKRRELRMPS